MQAYSQAVRSPTLYPNDNQECWIWFVPGSVAPMLLGAMEALLVREAWADDDKWAEGRNSLLSVKKGAYMLCAADLIAEIRALRGVREESEAIPPEERTIDDYVTLRDLLDLETVVSLNSHYVRATYNVLRNALTGEATNGAEFTEEGARVEVTGIQASSQATALSLYSTPDFAIEEAIPPKINAALREPLGAGTAYDRLSGIETALNTSGPGGDSSAAELLVSLLGILA